MDYETRIGERTATVSATVLDEDGRIEMAVDGEAASLQLRVVAPHHLHVGQAGGASSSFVVRTDAGTWVWSKGRARFVEDGTQRRATRSAGGGIGKDVTPPMPAVVVDVLVKAGDEVDKGAPLVVVAAMKMETTLVAPHAGTVSAVNTAVGAKVNPGDILVEIDARPEDDEAESAE